MDWIEIFAVLSLVGAAIYGTYSFYQQDKQFKEEEMQYMNMKK